MRGSLRYGWTASTEARDESEGTGPPSGGVVEGGMGEEQKEEERKEDRGRRILRITCPS